MAAWYRSSRGSALALVGFLALAFVPLLSSPAHAKGYKQTNLVSDLPGVARRMDPNLVNPWGIVFTPDGDLMIADNGTGVSTAYHPNGRALSLVVTIPPPAGSPPGTTAAPTGMVFNPTSDFIITEGGKSRSARFLFATEDGTIAGWNPDVDPINAILGVDNSASLPGAVYKGIALAQTDSGNFIYVTNFRTGVVEMYDGSFNFTGSFTDPTLAAGFAPFGIRNIGGDLYVTFAKQDADRHDDVAGPGNGLVDVFDPSGNLIRRLAVGTALGGTLTALNSPWGLAPAPDDFGQFSNALLVGNFGDGRINAFDPATGDFLGPLTDRQGNPVEIEGLWGLTFSNDADDDEVNVLYFTAGLNHEADGLFGTLRPVPPSDHEGGR